MNKEFIACIWVLIRTAAVVIAGALLTFYFNEKDNRLASVTVGMSTIYLFYISIWN